MLRNRKIGTQIGIGFGLVLLIMGLVSLFAVKGLKTGSDSFKAYRSLARQSVLSGRVQANMLMASKAAKDFLKTREETHLGVFDTRFRQAMDFAQEQSDAEASDLAAEIDSQIEDGEFRNGIQAITHCIDDFEFDEALERLNVLREMMRS